MSKILDLSGKPIMKPSVTNHTNSILYGLYAEFNRLNNGLLGVLLKSKLQEFDKNNRLRYQTILENLSRIESNYFVQEDDDNATLGRRTKMEKIIEEGKQPRVEPILLVGSTMEDYNKDKTEYMNQFTVIVY